MKRVLIFIIASVALIAGCYGDEKFERPEVVRISPERDSSTVLPDVTVTVEFSKSMDTVKTNSEFSLSSGSGGIDGYYSWDADGRTLTFTPKSSLTRAESYTIRITENAEDADGNDLSGEFLSVFYTGGDLGQPRVVSYTPAANTTGNAENSTITVRFSEAIDMNSVYSGITISPQVQGNYSANGDLTEIMFTPLYGFKNGVTYTANITESVKDAAGNKLLAPVTFSFTVGDDFIKPSLTAYQNLAAPLYLNENSIISGAEKNRTITLDFSEEIDGGGLENAVNISPSVPFYITDSRVVAGGVAFTRGIINFTENLASEETYTLRISATVTDLQDNPLDHDYRFVFRTDGSGSISPEVDVIGDLQPDNTIAGWEKDEIIFLNLQELSPEVFSKLYDNIAIDFTAVMEPATLSITVENVAGEGDNASVVNIDWPATGVTRFQRVRFGLYGASSGNTYKIVIKGGKNGLKDINGNYIKDFIQLVRF